MQQNISIFSRSSDKIATQINSHQNPRLRSRRHFSIDEFRKKFRRNKHLQFGFSIIDFSSEFVEHILVWIRYAEFAEV